MSREIGGTFLFVFSFAFLTFSFQQVNASPWAHRTKMCPDADAKTTVQDISNDNNLVLTQEKSSRKGKIIQMNLTMVKA